MDLFIQIKDGKPFEHPIFGGNFREAFPTVDTENLPESFARFVRVDLPSVGVYEVCETSYEWEGNLVTDVHRIRAMTSEEVAIKQNAVKSEWAQTGFASWVFDEATCSYLPPVQRPQGGVYRWNEATASWVEVSVG